MARDRDNRKTATGQPKSSDAMDEEVVPDDQKDSDEDPLPSGKGDDEEDSDEEIIPMRVPRKKTAVKTPARSTKAEDRAACTAWYQTFLGVKANAAEYLYDEEDLDKPSAWVKLNDKTISMIVKGWRALSTRWGYLLSFACTMNVSNGPSLI